MELKEKNDQQLIELYSGLHASIYGMDCFSVHDLQLLDATGCELQQRGYTITDGYAPPVIAKPEAEEGDDA